MTPVKLKIGNIIVYVVLLCLVILTMVSLHRCSKFSNSETKMESSGGDTIDVAIEYSPLSFYTSYDVLAAELPVTADYKDRYSLLEPVLLDKRVLVQLKDSITGEVPVKSQLDLAGDSVWIVDGSSVKDRIENLCKEIGDTVYVKSDPEYGSEYLFLMTALGETKQAVISEKVARAMVEEYPQVDVSTGISFNQFQSWVASNRRPELKDSLNKWIAEIKLTPEYTELERRYLSE